MRRYAAEAIGTFAVVFTGCGAMAVAGPKLGDAGVALAFGLALAVMGLALAPISGAHCNPAVTVAMAITRRLPGRDVLPYVAAQLCGGAAGAALVVAMAEGRPGSAPLAAQTIATGYGRLSPGSYTLGAALIAEFTLTALFVLVVLGASARWSAGDVPRRIPAAANAAVASGMAYGLIHLVGLSITRLAANPARALGPALLAGGAALEQVWLFLAAPIAGGIAAAFTYRALYGVAPVAAAPRVLGTAGTTGTAVDGTSP